MAVATEKKITPNLPSPSMYFLSHFYSENIKKKKNYKSNSMINFIYHLDANFDSHVGTAKSMN
jgi:hypothetical protein